MGKIGNFIIIIIIVGCWQLSTPVSDQKMTGTRAEWEITAYRRHLWSRC